MQRADVSQMYFTEADMAELKIRTQYTNIYITFLKTSIISKLLY